MTSREGYDAYTLYLGIKLHFYSNDYDFVKYNGVTYERKTINGKDMIIVDGEAKEAGSHDFPWENDANNGK